MATLNNDQSKKELDTKREFTRTTNNLLRSWTPATTRLLVRQQNCSLQTSFDILDYCFPSNFAEALIAEIQNNSKWRDELRPAKTTGDVQLSNLMSSFLATTTETNSVEQPPHNSVRGDSSMFIPREHRQQRDFHTANPHVSHLISSIQKTVQHSLEPFIDFDMSQTSVQLATYPGDGCSGYVRHCDRGQDHCKHETDSNVRQDHRKGRIVTAIYYLTPSDWSEELDGGCLRLFCDSQNDKQGDGFYDVVPFQNRLVVFRSDGVEHQVMPSLRRERMALTIWFYGSVNTISSSVTINAHEYRIPPVLPSLSSSIPKYSMENASINKQDNDGPPPLCVDIHNVELLNHCIKAKIFVSIAAYRDTELGPTLKSLMDNAQSSQRIFVGVVLQIDTSPTTGTKTPTTPLAENNVDTKIWETLPSDQPWFHKQVRMITMDAKHAQGPCYARHLCQTLWRDEEYVLQIDSHMRFRRNWDTYLIRQLLSIDAKATSSDGCDDDKTTNIHSTTPPRTMLTAYPVGYTLPNTIPNETRGTLLVPWKFDNNGMLRQKGRLLESPRTSKGDASVIPCYLYAAGFNFARCHVIQDCPYDGELRHLFFGEEMSMAVRLYCKGYDLYAPTESVVYHLWSRTHRPTASSAQPLRKEEEEQKMLQKKASREKVLRQLCGSEDSVRNASQFASVLGANFDNHTMQADAELGRLSPEAFAADKSFLGVATTARTTPSPDRANNPTAHTVPTLDVRAQTLISAFLGSM